ncbi:MAG: site-specific integrase [Limnohabitans sp.]|nr:site-specific integrase [Limnohabitans sp.]
MGSIVKESVNRGGKQVTRYRAHVRRAGFKSQSKSFYSHAEAKAWLRNAESDAEQKKDQDKGIYRFSAVADLFAKTPPRRGTKFWSPTHLGYWEEQFGTRDIKTITRADINVSLAALQVKKVERRTITGQIKQTERPISSSTANRYLASLSSLFNFALDAGLIDRHPIKGGQVRKLTEGNGRTRILTTEEEDRLIAEAERSTWPPMALFLRLALTTGARKSELLRLRWADIDLDRRIAVIPKTKNGEVRALPLVLSVRDALKAAKKVQPLASDLVFFNPKDPGKPKNIETIWKHVRQRSGLEADRADSLDRVVLHSTRHTAATKLIRGGANLIQAAAVTGHKTVGMLKKYTHLGADDVVALADRLLEQRK